MLNQFQHQLQANNLKESNHCLKDLKNQEIADILGISLDTAKIRLHRARIRLKAEFEAGCDFYHDKDGKLACDRKHKKTKRSGRLGVSFSD